MLLSVDWLWPLSNESLLLHFNLIELLLRINKSMLGFPEVLFSFELLPLCLGLQKLLLGNGSFTFGILFIFNSLFDRSDLVVSSSLNALVQLDIFGDICDEIH